MPSACKGSRKLVYTAVQGAVAGAVDHAIGAASHNFPVTMDAGGMIEDTIHRQRPVLHQTAHVHSPSPQISCPERPPRRVLASNPLLRRATHQNRKLTDAP